MLGTVKTANVCWGERGGSSSIKNAGEPAVSSVWYPEVKLEKLFQDDSLPGISSAASTSENGLNAVVISTSPATTFRSASPSGTTWAPGEDWFNAAKGSGISIMVSQSETVSYRVLIMVAFCSSSSENVCVFDNRKELT